MLGDSLLRASLDNCNGGKVFVKGSPGSWCLVLLGPLYRSHTELSVEGSLPAPHPIPRRYPPLRVPSAAPFPTWQAGFPEVGGSSERLGSVLNSQSREIGEGKLGQLWQLEFTQFTYTPPCLLLSTLFGFWLVTLDCPC